MKLKYILIFSIAISLIAGSALADSPTTWIRGNVRYTRIGNSVKISLVNPSLKVEPKNNSQTPNIQLDAQSQFSDIVSISEISDINVTVGTDLASVDLPDTVVAKMSDKSAKTSPVLWDDGTPAYDGNTTGIYVFSGTPVLSGKFTNAQSVKATVNVIVGPQSTTPTGNIQNETSQTLEEITNPPAETASPTDESLSQTATPTIGSDIIQNAASSLLNGVGDFFNFMFSPFKTMLKIK